MLRVSLWLRALPRHSPRGLGALATNTKQFKLAAAEAKRYGIGTDVLMSGKAEVIADVGDYTQGGTMVERGLRSAANKFGRINFLDYWTSGMKQLHAVTMQTSIFDGLSKGKFDKRLTRLGIDKQSAKDMMEQVNKYGKNEDGVWITNAKNWDRPDLERMWGAAMRKESDRVIIMPGQEKPLFMSCELGKSYWSVQVFHTVCYTASTCCWRTGPRSQRYWRCYLISGHGYVFVLPQVKHCRSRDK